MTKKIRSRDGGGLPDDDDSQTWPVAPDAATQAVSPSHSSICAPRLVATSRLLLQFLNLPAFTHSSLVSVFVSLQLVSRMLGSSGWIPKNHI